MRRGHTCVGLLVGVLALSAGEREAAGESLLEALANGDRPAAQMMPISRTAPSLRTLNRSAGSARAYSPWLRAGMPEAQEKASTEVRTMCVRTCDGYYWPMSEGAGRAEVMRDASACISSCRSEARLFTLPRTSANIAAMTDLTGRSYGTLENAFLYRKALKPGCGCQPAPWSSAAKARHARYAEIEAINAARLAASLAAPRPPAKLTFGSSQASWPAPVGRFAVGQRPVSKAAMRSLEDEQHKPQERSAHSIGPATIERPAAAVRARRQSISAARKRMVQQPSGRGLFAW